MAEHTAQGLAVTTAEPSAGRHAGFELGRAVAMLAVVFVHVPPAPALYALLRPFVEFCVPYFFVLSGFLWAAREGRARSRPRGAQHVWSALRRLLLLYAVGFAVYAVLPLDWIGALRQGQLGAAILATTRHSLDALAEAPLATLLDGPPGGFHLWFLSALVLGLAVVGVGLHLRRGGALAALAIGLFVFGLLAGRYAEVALGVPASLSVRNGPFQSVALVGVGALLARRGLPGPRGLRGPLLLLLGQLLVFAEAWLVGSAPGASGGPDVFSAAALPLGVGAFLLFHDLPIRAPWAQRLARRAGATTLGVYLWHVLLRVPVASVLAVVGLYPRDGSNPWWGFIALFAVTLGCVAVYQAALRRRARRRPRSGSVELEAV